MLLNFHPGSNFLKSFRLFSEALGGGEVPIETPENEEDSDDDIVEANSVEITEILTGGDAEGNLDIHLPPHLRCASHRLNNVASTDALKAIDDPLRSRKWQTQKLFKFLCGKF